MAESNALMSDDQFLGTDASSSSVPLMSDDQFLGPSNPVPGALANSSDDSMLSSAGKNIATGAIKGLADIPGMIGNAESLRDYLIARGMSAITGKDTNELLPQVSNVTRWIPNPMMLSSLGHESPTGEQIAAPILKQTGEYQPTSTAGKMVQGGVEALTGSLGMEGGLVGMGERTLGSLARSVPANFLAGAAGTGAADVTGDPLAGMAAGSLAGGVTNAGVEGAGSYVRPMLKGSQEAMAGEQLAARANNLPAAQSALETAPQQLVPGSKPTLGELTGDIGFLQAEREARTADNTEFNLREGEQNAARRAALMGQRPNADVMSPSEHFQASQAAIDQAEQNGIAFLQDHAQDLAGQLGAPVAPEQAGAAIRNGIEAARQQARTARSALYAAVDPDNSLNLVTAPVRQQAQGILQGIGQFAAQPQGTEASILGIGSQLPDVMHFSDLLDFDKQITAAMSQERRTAGETPALGRLTQLKSSVSNAINNAIDNQANYERQAVQAGSLSPDETIETRLGQQARIFGAPQEAATSASGVSASDASGASSTSFSGPRGTNGQAVGGLGSPAGDSGVSAPPLEPNFDQAAAERLAAAKAAHANYAQTYRQGPVSPVLKTTGFQSQYQLPESAVPSRAVVAGDRGYDTAQSFLKAAQGNPDVTSAMQDYLLNPLRQKAIGLDGTISPKGLADWKSKYAGAIKAMDEASPGFSSQFDDAAKASDAMTQMGLARKQRQEAFQKSEAAKFVGKTNPIEVENQIGTLLSAKQNGPTRMRALVQQASSNPETLQGLRASGIDWMMRQFSNAAEGPGTDEPTLSSAKFQRFVRDNKATLSELYPPETVNAMQAVSADLARADRSVTATRIKGSPGTAKDVMKFTAKRQHPTSEQIATWEIGLEALRQLHEGNVLGAGKELGALLIGKKALDKVKSMRAAGIENVQDMVKDALLNPERAKYYLAKANPLEADKKIGALSASLRRSLMTWPAVQAGVSH